MNSHGSAAPALAELSDVGQRARRRIAYRLLPFVFLIYIVNYIDRVNVSFANLRMSADLGFSDRVYGLGVGMFYLTYVLFEIPGAIIVERWSARKWIARIMISWGIVTLARAQPGHRLLICSCSRRVVNRIARGGVATRSTLGVAGGVALALYSGGNSCHRPRDRHRLLLDGLACAGALASSGRTRLARQ